MKCRHCQTSLNTSVIDLGSSPPSNAYLTKQMMQEPETWFPLRVLVCEQCWLVQTEDFANRELLFAKDYAYFSSFSKSWLAHAKNYQEMITERLNLDSKHLVVEIAANDGYLLQYFQEAGIPNYGVEPTTSTAKAARAKGIEIVEDFFGVKLAEKLLKQRGPANLIAANNVLAHVPDINDFLQGFQTLLDTNGVATFEFPHLVELIDGAQFDTIYHEHFSYLSLSAINTIFEANGLVVFDVDSLETHGGSLRIYAARADAPPRPKGPNLEKVSAMEKERGVCTTEYYGKLQARALQAKLGLLRFLLDAKANKQTVAGYGAAAKGNTLLNYSGVGADLVSFVTDKNPEKQNRYLPGSRIPVCDIARIRADKPDHILILPWNLKREIAEQLDFVREWDGQLWTAIPEINSV